MEPEAKAVTISLPLPMAQQFAQVMEGFLGSLYQALEADASMSPMQKGNEGAIPLSPNGQKPPTAEEAAILDALAGQE
jgi:hypothetical protein